MKAGKKLTYLTGAALATFVAGSVQAADMSKTLDLSNGVLVAEGDAAGCKGKKDAHDDHDGNHEGCGANGCGGKMTGKKAKAKAKKAAKKAKAKAKDEDHGDDHGGDHHE